MYSFLLYAKNTTHMTKHNIWSISIIGILFALLFTPLIVASSLYFPYVTGKVFAFRIGVSIIAVLYAILVYKKPEFLPKKSSILSASGLFVLFLVVSNSFGTDPFNSFFSNFERMEGWFTHFYLFLYLVIISSVFTNQKIWNWFFEVSLLVANILALNALFDSTERTQVFLGNSTYVAVYALFNLFFALLLGYRSIKKQIQPLPARFVLYVYYMSSVLLLGYLIFRTQTRGTVLGLISSLILFLILTAITYRKNKKVRLISISLFAITIAGAGIFWSMKDSQFVVSHPSLARIATISASEGTGKARLMNWGIALEGIKENPILGWGQENYVYVFSQYYNPNMYAQEPWFDRTHNSYLDWTIQGGIIALLLYCVLFILPIISLHRSVSLTRTEKNIMMSLFFAYAIHNFFVFDNYSSYLMFFSVLGFVVFNEHKQSINWSWDEKIKQITLIICIALICIASYFTIIRPYSVAKDLVHSLGEKDATTILTSFEKMLEKNSFGNFEVVTQLLTNVSSFTQVKDATFVKSYLTLANNSGEDFITKKPKNVRALEFYGTFLLQTGDYKKAIEVLEQAREQAPNRQNNLYVLGFAYLSDNQIDKATEVFKHAYEVQTDNIRAQNYYGGMLLLKGDESGKNLIKGYNPNDTFFLSIFTKTKQYKEVVKILNERIKQQPTNYQLQISLAVAYVFENQRPKAIELIQSVMEKVPEFKKQGQELINQIKAGKNPAL